jgi:hypothetical protein
LDRHSELVAWRPGVYYIANKIWQLRGSKLSGNAAEANKEARVDSTCWSAKSDNLPNGGRSGSRENPPITYARAAADDIINRAASVV